MAIKLTINDTALKTKLRELGNISDNIMKDAYKEFVKHTPVASDNARRKTSYSNKVIHADYPYAAVLDAGRGYRDGQMRGSDQAPSGMTKPVLEYIKQEVIKQVRNRGSK